jgi:hypothetical protein
MVSSHWRAERAPTADEASGPGSQLPLLMMHEFRRAFRVAGLSGEMRFSDENTQLSRGTNAP